MYIIKLNPTDGSLYKAVYDEGFQVTFEVAEATKFTGVNEAEHFVNTYAVVTLYPAATIEKIKI
jgi:hypothetical protein